MRDPNRKVIYLLWAVVVVLVAGGIAGGSLLVHKADDLKQANSDLGGDVDSLRSQLKQAKASPTPSPASDLAPAPASAPTVTPTPTVTPAGR